MSAERRRLVTTFTERVFVCIFLSFMFVGVLYGVGQGEHIQSEYFQTPANANNFNTNLNTTNTLQIINQDKINVTKSIST